MRTASASPQPSDRTARARLRDAAVEVFAREGFSASVRTIAAAAGVSAPLVTHHFGTKDRLRQECDEHVLAVVRTAKQESIADVAGGGGVLQRLLGHEAYAVPLAYVLRSVQDGGPAGRAFLEHMVEDAVRYTEDAVAAGIARPSRDEAARARYLTLSALGGLLLSITLDAPDDPRGVTTAAQRWVAEIALPTLELYTEGFFTTRRMLDDYLAYAGRPTTTDTDADDDEPDRSAPRTEGETR